MKCLHGEVPFEALDHSKWSFLLLLIGKVPCTRIVDKRGIFYMVDLLFCGVLLPDDTEQPPTAS